MKKFLLSILLALGALIAPASAQQQGQALVVTTCGLQSLTAATYGFLTMLQNGELCTNATGGGGGGGAVFGPTAAGSAAANPPVIVGGTADGTATGSIVNWKVLAGIGYINCANCSGSGVSSVDEVAFVAGTSLFAGTGGFFQTTATSNPLTNGQQGMFQVTANRALFSNLRNAAGAEIGVAAAPVQVSLANTAANATPVLVNQPTGTNLHAVLDTTSTTAVTQATGTNLHAVIDTGSTTAVTQATGTNLHSVVDSGTITTVSTVTSLAQQTGWAGGTLGAMANYGTSPGAVLVPGVNAFITNANANIGNNADAVASGATAGSPVVNYSYIFNGTTFDRIRSGTTTGSVLVNGAGTAGTAAGGVVTVQGAAAMTKLLVTPDSVALPANQSVNVAQFGGVSTSTGQVAVSVAPATATNTALVVDLRPDSPGIINLGVAADTASVPVVSSPSGNATAGIAPVVCGSAVSSCVLKASAGNLYAAYADCTAACWLMVFNSTSAPSNGATTAGIAANNMTECVPIAAGGVGGINYPTFPSIYTTGMTAAISSTACATLTLSAVGFVHGLVK